MRGRTSVSLKYFTFDVETTLPVSLLLDSDKFGLPDLVRVEDVPHAPLKPVVTVTGAVVVTTMILPVVIYYSPPVGELRPVW